MGKDSPFEMWFRYWLQYRLKVSITLSFGFRPKPKKGLYNSKSGLSAAPSN